jgi:hypothetical protein
VGCLSGKRIVQRPLLASKAVTAPLPGAANGTLINATAYDLSKDTLSDHGV